MNNTITDVAELGALVSRKKAGKLATDVAVTILFFCL